ncbi:MAG TPA: GspE/PulE family protein, partial [Nitrospiria bacterium]
PPPLPISVTMTVEGFVATALTKENVIAILIREGLLTPDQVREYETKGELQKVRLAKKREGGRRSPKASKPPLPAGVVELLASFRFEIANRPAETLTEDRIMEALARSAGLSYMKLDPLKLDASVVTRMIPKLFALAHSVLPIRLKSSPTGEVLVVATADPFNQDVLDQLRSSTKYPIEPVVSSRTDIQKVITEFHGFRTSVTAAERELDPGLDLGNLEQYVRLQTAAELESTDKHVVKAVEYMLQYAYDQRASDIHIEPKRDQSLIRFRIDGMLHDVNRIPRVVHNAVVARIKSISRMDIAERRKPQDGRIKTQHRDREIELRVSTLPVAFGEKVVIRIFDPEVLLQPLEALGFYPREFELFQGFLQKPHGLILVTGPTGSGKTTTLYSALKTLATAEVNVTTIEDPIEMICEGFNQVGIQPLAGITFAGSLRTILRQDPDIIMVGEIRDLETAEHAIQASLTGHLVFSTLHTNDAPSAVTRLLDLGVPPFLISSTLTAIVAQRLVRKICESCADAAQLSFQEAQSLGIKFNPEAPVPVRYGRGCVQCRGTGYRGRTGIHEVLDLTDAIREAITEKRGQETIRALAREQGMKALRDCAIRKMLDGVTTFQEVQWITGGG